MGLGGISPLSLLLILAIVLVIFGSKRLTSLGHDVGTAIKSFREGLSEESKENDESQ